MARKTSHLNLAIRALILVVGVWATGNGQGLAQSSHGEQIYNTVCIGCHQIGVLGAPRKGDRTVWTERMQKGLDILVQHALSGFGKMPAKGGNPSLDEKDLRAAIQFMAGDDVVAAAGKMSVAPIAATAAGINLIASVSADSERGADVVKRVCQGCHEVGVLKAPRIGNAEEWAPRLKKGEDTLVQNASNGVGNMPPKGGNPDLTVNDLRAAIRFMSTARAPAVARAAPPVAPQAKVETAPPPPSGVNAAQDPNRFNRLMRPLTDRNPAPPLDGIHDPSNDGTGILQPPKTAFDAMPKSMAGNYVDWVKALQQETIQPRWDLKNPELKPLVMDLNIIREVKGSMPDVVYPHKQHLQWLDCSNCHPAIFEPRKGANQISMAEILMGRKCGVCHGKVAFPVSECRLCHSKKKPDMANK